MRLGLLVPTNLWFCPYVNIYTTLLDQYEVAYDLIYWNRDLKADAQGITFNKEIGSGKLEKLLGYWQYSKFLKKIIKKNRYDKLIVFSSQIGIFLASFLRKHYKNRYIFDFRDLSIEQMRIFRTPFDMLLENGYSNVISSPRFKQYLPNIEYLVSHNFMIEDVKEAVDTKVGKYEATPIKILTIGGIRDFESNSKIIDAIGNKEKFLLQFIGKGPSKESLEEYAKESNVENIQFKGYYEKKEEPSYIIDSTFLNIYYPDVITHKTALSNRFYNSLIYRRPMIVTKGQIQGDYAEKYGVGIAIENTEGLTEKLENWIKEVDFQEYENRCVELLKQFVEDYNIFEQTIKDFLNISRSEG